MSGGVILQAWQASSSFIVEEERETYRGEQEEDKTLTFF